MSRCPLPAHRSQTTTVPDVREGVRGIRAPSPIRESGKIKGKKVSAIRRMLDRRAGRTKRVKDSGFGQTSHSHRPSPDELLRVYQKEAEKQWLLARKAEFAQSRLLFIVEAIKDLLSDDGFATLLRAENLATMPRALAGRMDRGVER